MNKAIKMLGTALVLLASTLAAQGQTVDLGYGIEHSELLSSASTMTITGEELSHTSAVSLSEALYGKLLGLTVISKGGWVGDENFGATFNIRGIQTYSEDGNAVTDEKHKILILVDGYERPINRMSVAEVESVTVLKDAAALALLGHKAVNGAILVKTKKGASGATRIKAGYSHKFTFDPEFAEMADGYLYASAMNKARANDGLSPAYTDQELALIKDGSDPFFYPNVNWKDEAFRKMGSQDNANLAVTGGNDAMQFYTVMDYTQDMGLLNGTQQKDYSSQLRYSKANIRANLDFKASPTTKLSVHMLGIFIESAMPNDLDANGVTNQVYITPMNAFPIKTSSGYWGGNETYGDANVVAKIQESGYLKTHQRQLWADASLEQDLGSLLSGLSFRADLAYDNSSIMKEVYAKAHQYAYEYYTGAIGDKENVKEVVMGNKENNLTFSNRVSTQWRRTKLAAGFHYNRSFRGDDHFSAAAIYDYNVDCTDGQGNTFYRSDVMGTFHYDLQDKYIVDLTLAANGSNRSYPAKWAFSPTFSAAWNFVNAPEASFLNFGKLRASAGILHYDYVPAIGIWLENWNNSNGHFYYGEGTSSSSGMFLKSRPTTRFSQEAAAKINFGTDIVLWNSLSLTADLFWQKRSHILVSAQEENSWVVGIQSAYDDVAAVTSRGIELGARFNRKFGRSLFVNASAFLTMGDNKIAYTIENPAYPNLSSIGSRVDEAKGLQAIGFFKDQNDINNSPVQEFSAVYPGDIKYKDQNGDGVINEFDVISLGKGTSVPSTNYSFNLGVEWAGFGINASLQGAAGQFKSIRSIDGIWNVMSDHNNLSMDYYDNCWDVRGNDALYPRLSSQKSQNNSQHSSVWFKDISFFKLRYCEAYYKLPASLLSRMKVAGAKVFVMGENLFSIDSVDAMDAEVLSTRYPLLKSVNLGLSVTF